MIESWENITLEELENIIAVVDGDKKIVKIGENI